MIQLDSPEALRHWRHQGPAACFVPTMGALHEGHAALVRAARQHAGSSGRVLVSVFVNPLQFAPGEDLDRYPRTLAQDLALCEACGADAVYAPLTTDFYAADRSISISESSLSKGLCGASRPGHFDGVCTVVAKLFNQSACADAFFGKKDYQQLAIIRRMVRDLDLPVRIHALDTVREADGLAMSSRNRYLTVSEREQAPAIYQGLQRVQALWRGGQNSATSLLEALKAHLLAEAPLGSLDYAVLVNRDTLQPVEIADSHSLLALALRFGGARLIDNLELQP